eukprot:89140-Amphidinium_carterae.1
MKTTYPIANGISNAAWHSLVLSEHFLPSCRCGHRVRQLQAHNEAKLIGKDSHLQEVTAALRTSIC